ncbi:MAG: beta-galactosidase [Clostridiales bacterium]|nr:beta-galactosidase [Clostridiales bacterium]
MKCIIYSKDFPYEGERPDDHMLGELAKTGEIVSPGELSDKLREKDFDCIISLHGSYFPKKAWKQILEHLNRGKGLLNIGGAPFRTPVAFRDGNWKVEREQTAYHKELNIVQVYKVPGGNIDRFENNPDFGTMNGNIECIFEKKDVYEFLVKFTRTKDHKNELGSSGPMEANMYPLVTGLSAEGCKIAAPVVLIENTKGRYAGGRWIFVNQHTTGRFWTKDGLDFINTLGDMVSRPVVEMIIRPGYASYYPGEQPLLLMQAQSLGKRDFNIEADMQAHFDNEPYEDKQIHHDNKSCTDKYNYYDNKPCMDKHIYNDNKPCADKHISLDVDENIKYISIPMDFIARKGFYKIEMVVHIDREKRKYTTGFWGYDRELMESGSRLEATGDYFTKGGKVVPLVGMTYMASDVHRKYLYIPNAAVWYNDFAFMKASGINIVRTGIWTSFRNIMFVDGIASEEVMRAIDAFFITARYFDMDVIFNFFAFTPEMWEGANPYLDPQSIAAQKHFISAIASRHSKSINVSWDLINEPSVCNPLKAFSGPQPNRDEYELAEWRSYLKERHGDIALLQERWNALDTEFKAFENIMLPDEREFQRARNPYTEPNCVENAYTKPNWEPIKSLRLLDYGLFTNHVLNRWADEMIKTIRSCGSDQMITIGQDHATSDRRPHPYFHKDKVDYTSVHPWWQNDDTYWDCIFARVQGKPMLVQETGVMYIEDNNEMNRRTEEQIRDILERKFAYAFASGGAGAIQWILNANIYMDSVNEASVGSFRADGTEKPEFDVIRGLGRFFRECGYIFESEAVEEDICVIFSFSNSYSNRAYTNISTRKAARVLAYLLKIGFKGCGDNDLSMIGSSKLIIYPSPRVIPGNTWDGLVEKVKEGATLLVTGPANYDEYWNRVERTSGFGFKTRLTSVSREESVYIEGKPFRVAFEGQKTGWVDKETVSDLEQELNGTNELNEINLGKGKIIWCPLPIEMNMNDEVIEAIYQKAIGISHVKNDIRILNSDIPGIFIKKLKFTAGCIYILVSETGSNTQVEFEDNETGYKADVMIQSERAMLLAVDKEGRIISRYNV